MLGMWCLAQVGLTFSFYIFISDSKKYFSHFLLKVDIVDHVKNLSGRIVNEGTESQISDVSF